MEVSRFSNVYKVRRLCRRDTDKILSLCSGNALYYQYCPPFVTKQSIADDMRALPPKKSMDDKYYVGYFVNGTLIAVMDLIASYPDEHTAFIGFFMTDVSVQHTGVGSGIVNELCSYLKDAGFTSVRLGWVKGNPQAEGFWRKNGFSKTGKTYETGGYTVMLAQRNL